MASFREFLKGNFSLDDFSEIANHVKTIFPIDSKSTEQNDYVLVVYEAADVSLYIRKHEKSNDIFVGLMETIWTYFGKYKHLLNDLPGKYSTPAVLETNDL